MPKTIMEWLELEFLGKTYKLNLTEGEYSVNGRKYYWLYDSEDWEPFADVTANYPDINLADDEALLDWDFVMCFDNEWKAIMWLGKYGIAKGPINRDWVWWFKF